MCGRSKPLALHLLPFSVMDLSVTWGAAGLGGDSSAVQGQLKDVQQIQASDGAFAAILGDGSIVTWGSAGFGGDSRAVQNQLKNVQQVQATRGGAFAAILAYGSVVTWGDAACGGDSSAVQSQLKNVRQIQAARGYTGGAFAAILNDGSVVTWGAAALRWRQQCRAGSAEGCATDPSFGLCVCCHSWRWIRRDMG